MKPSTWLLIVVLVLLAGHWHWLVEVPLAALNQPIALAVTAVAIIAVKIRKRHA